MEGMKGSIQYKLLQIGSLTLIIFLKYFKIVKTFERFTLFTLCKLINNIF